MESNYRNNSGISQVIGVILMVAVVVILVAIVTFTVFNSSEGASEPADSSVQIEKLSEGIQVTVLRNENVDEFVINSPDSGRKIIEPDPGTTDIVPYSGSGEYSLVAELPDGGSQIVDEVTYESDLPDIDATVQTPIPDQNVGTLFSISGKVNESYNLQSSVPTSDDEAQIDISTDDKLRLNQITPTGDSYTAEFETLEQGNSQIDVEVTNNDGDSEVVNPDVAIIEPFDPSSEDPNQVIESGPESGDGNTIDTSRYSTAVVTLAGAQGGTAESAANGETKGGQGGQITVTADISDVDELCYGVGEQPAEPSPSSSGFGGSGYSSGEQGGLNAGGGGGSTAITDCSNRSNYIAEAGGGGGGGGLRFDPFTGDTPTRGGDGGDAINAVGGTGGLGSNGGGDATQTAGPLAVDSEVGSGNNGDGSITVELYEESL